jgi:hypothetical protein
MPPKPLRTAALAALAAGLLLAGGARADEAPGEESAPVEIPEPAPAEPAPAEPAPAAEVAELPPLGPGSYDGELAYDDWSSRRSWGYGTYYFFPLTRHMGEAGIPWPARPVLWLVSVPFDVGHLPWAVVSGLYGD